MVSYNKLWKLLIDKQMKKKDLGEAAGVSANTLAKMGKNEMVSLAPEVMKALVKQVTVYPDKQIYIEWNFSDNVYPFISKTN